MNKRREPPFPSYVLPNHAWVTKLEAGADVVEHSGKLFLVRRGPLSWWEEEIPAPNTDAPVAEVEREARRLLCVLSYRAYRGNEESAQALARLVSDATPAVWWIACNKPGMLRPYARDRFTWPVLRQARERLSTREKSVFSEIQLGRDHPLEHDPSTSKRKWDTAARIANDLFACVHSARLGAGNLGGMSARARKLAAFSDDSALAWWDLAQTYLLKSYPDIECVHEFMALVTAPSKRKSPGRMRQAILECIRNRFLSLAPNLSYQT